MSAPNDTRVPDGWRQVRFGDVVRNTNNTTRNPEADGIERVVGLTHLDSDSLPIRRWDTLDESTSFTRTFRAGQVLFGKRRAYQRKVGVPDFPGICSGDILVFESKSPDLLQEFLPHIVQSDQFFERAVGTSAGSLSPRTKWQDLSKYEFALPPLDEQQQIVLSLDTTLAVAETRLQAAAAARDLREIVGSIASGTADRAPLGDLLSRCDYGLSVRGEPTGDLPILRMNAFSNGEIHWQDLQWVPAKAVPDNLRLAPGDIVFNRTNSMELVGQTAIVDRGVPDATFASYLLRLRVRDGLATPEWICAYLQSPAGRRQLASRTKRGVSQANISAGELKKLAVPIPCLEVQTAAAERWNAARRLQATLAMALEQDRKLGRQLRQRLLEGSHVH